MCGEYVTDRTTGHAVRWTEYRKTMSWFEWFVPQCPTCFMLRFGLAIISLPLLAAWLEPPFWSMFLIFGGAYTLASSIGNAQPRNWFACMGERRKTKEP